MDEAELDTNVSPTLRLTYRAEEAVVKKVAAQARDLCDSEIKKFIECTKGRYISVVWACQAQKQIMNDCVKQYTTDERIALARMAHAREFPISVTRE